MLVIMRRPDARSRTGSRSTADLVPDKVKTVGHGNGITAIQESLNNPLLKGAIVTRRCIAVTSTVCMSSRPGTAGRGLLGRFQFPIMRISLRVFPYLAALKLQTMAFLKFATRRLC